MLGSLWLLISGLGERPFDKLEGVEFYIVAVPAVGVVMFILYTLISDAYSKCESSLARYRH